jgi:hypothetical protein
MQDNSNQNRVNTARSGRYAWSGATISVPNYESIDGGASTHFRSPTLQYQPRFPGSSHMIRFVVLLFVVFLVRPAVYARDDALLARVTVYWASGGSGSDKFTRHHRCATGTRLRAGHCAVDPHHIPYGSRVILPNGETLAAVDTGSAVKNRKAARRAGRTSTEKHAIVVDRFFETKRQALAWANTHPLFMPVRVVRPNYRSLPPLQPTARLQVASSALSTNQSIPTNPAAQSIQVAAASPNAGSRLNHMGRATGL